MSSSNQHSSMMNEGGGDDQHNQHSRKRNSAEISGISNSMSNNNVHTGQDPRAQRLSLSGFATEHLRQPPQQQQQHTVSNESLPFAQCPQNANNSTNNAAMMGSEGGRARRLPCKARGMGDSHTTATAFFDIPHDLKHGAVLACSHRLCANSGRRFRYCQVCEVPVAKRNFQKRHSHGLIPVGDPMLLVSNMHRMNNNGSNQNKNNSNYQNREDQNDDDPHGRHRRSVSYDAADTLNQLCATSGTDASDLKPEAAASQAQQASAASIQLSSKEYQWLALLHNRPSVHDTGGMEEWMTNIIDISERTAAVAAAAAAASAQARQQQQQPPAPAPAAPHPNLLALAQTITVANNAEANAMEKSRAAATGLKYANDQEADIMGNSPGAASMLAQLGGGAPGNNMTPAQMNASMFSRQPQQAHHSNARPAPMSAAALAAAHANGTGRTMFPTSKPQYPSKPSNDNTMASFKEKLLASEAAVDSGDETSTTSNRQSNSRLDDNPETLADYVAKKAAAAIARAGVAKQMANGDFCGNNNNSSTNLTRNSSNNFITAADSFDDDSQRSQSSSVATRPTIRRRRSVQNARQLMGLIKLSGMTENHYDDMFASDGEGSIKKGNSEGGGV